MKAYHCYRCEIIFWLEDKDIKEEDERYFSTAMYGHIIHCPNCGSVSHVKRDKEADMKKDKDQKFVTENDLRNWFEYHPPTETQEAKYGQIRSAAFRLALSIFENTPPGPDQTVAIRKIREAVMTANAAIACEVKK